MNKNANRRFGIFIKDHRSRMGINKGDFAMLIGEDIQLVNATEHGEPPSRRVVLSKMIDALNLSKEERGEGYRILDEFCPKRRIRLKVHFNFSKLQYRRRIQPVVVSQ